MMLANTPAAEASAGPTRDPNRMLKSVAVVAVAVVSALAAGQGLTAFAAAQRAEAAAVPPQPVAISPAEADPASSAAQVSKAQDGHYWAEAQVDGRWIHFLVDTGASTVALTRQDAQRLGFDLDNLVYDRPVSTANGKTLAAEVKLDRVSVAGARVDGVDALVVKDGLASSLLGMSYLGRLSRFEATPTALILRP
jgi:aspartyl protease family protein